MKKMRSSDFDILYTNIIRNIDDYDADYLYPQRFPFKLSNGQVNKLLNIPNKEKIFQLKNTDELKINYCGYFNLCLSLLMFNNWEYFTMDRLLKVLNEYIGLMKKGIVFDYVQSIESGLFDEEINDAPDAVQLLLVKRSYTKDERSVIEKIIEDNIESFLEDFKYERRYYSSSFNIPRFLFARLQNMFPFSVDFIKRNYQYFNLYEIYYNKGIMKDLEVQQLVFGPIRENTFNSILEPLTVGKVKDKPFKVTEEDVLASILKYNT